MDTPTAELYVCILRRLRFVLFLAADAPNGGFTGQNFFEEEHHFVVEGDPALYGGALRPGGLASPTQSCHSARVVPAYTRLEAGGTSEGGRSAQ